MWLRESSGGPCRIVRARRGVVAAWTLVSLFVFLAAFALALNAAHMAACRVEMQTATDAAALASARVLVNDALLLGQPGVMQGLIGEARREAVAYAGANPVLGETIELNPLGQNIPADDIVFGSLATPRAKEFALAGNVNDPNNALLLNINTVRVQAHRSRARGNALGLFGANVLGQPFIDVTVASTATLDRDVIGFAPYGVQTVPLVPVALLSDPTGANKYSWEYQVELKRGPDQFRFNPKLERFEPEPEGDGLHEMKVFIPLLGNQGQPGSSDQSWRGNSFVLQLGANNSQKLNRQFQTGVTNNDLAAFGGEFILGTDGRLIVTGTPGLPSSGEVELGPLMEVLAGMSALAEPRVWPLYIGFDPERGRAILTRFVAARLVTAGLTSDGKALCLILQPAMMACGSAVTDPSRREAGLTGANPYICKIRRVE
jgi:hypothetical protein